ncbi:MAG: hypothetical protein JWP61_2051 [Friedmanniella sp.]|nr:hypothetical protein [Friedmanniella sp.]
MSQPAPASPATLPAPPATPGAAVTHAADQTRPGGSTPASLDQVGAVELAPSRTARQLRWLSLGVVATGLIVGVVGALLLSYLALSLHRAEADTAQLLRVQRLQTDLLGADANATNAFLVGGQPAGQQAAYDRALTETGALVAEAARAQPADAAALAALNQQVLAYATVIEQARANNRQGFPVGAQYLRNASAQLRAGALPLLDNLVAANEARAAAEMNVLPGWGLVAVAVLGLAVVVTVHVWVSRRFRRRVNPGLAAAALLLLALVVAATIALTQLVGGVQAIRDGAFAQVNAGADARIEASNAKSNESLTLIARGSGQAFETAWAASATAVTSDLEQLATGPELQDRWDAYAAVHTRIRQQDDGGGWDTAVATATGTGANSANSAFTAFDTALAEDLASAHARTGTALAGQQPGLVVGALLSLLAGVGAALLGRRGVGARLREYR